MPVAKKKLESKRVPTIKPARLPRIAKPTAAAAPPAAAPRARRQKAEEPVRHGRGVMVPAAVRRSARGGITRSRRSLVDSSILPRSFF